MKQKHYWIYVLELNEGKYYVGLTAQRNPQDRIEQHKNGFYSAQWVKKYGYKGFLQVHDLGLTTPAEAEKVETRLTYDIMKQYGVDNVRGGVLNFSGKYITRFNRFFREDDWKALTTVTFLVLVILGLMLDKYLNQI